MFTFDMSNILCNTLHTALNLLSRKVGEGLVETEPPKKYCRKLATSLNKYVEEYLNFHGKNLHDAFTFLETAVRDLAICYENLEGINNPGITLVDNPTGDQHLIYYTANGSKLERELREIKSKAKAKEKFEFARENFRKCKEELTKICENESLTLQERITAIKIRVITEILGNLEDLTVAAKNCREIISELHESPGIRSLFRAVQPVNTTRAKFKMFGSKSVQSEETKNISSVININEAVFNFRKKFLRETVAIFDWPCIKENENPPTFHPIIGQSPMKIDRAMPNMPDSSTQVETNGLAINARISAISCKGEVFVVAKHKEKSSAIVRIVDGVVFPFWCLKERLQNDENASELVTEPSELEEPENIQIISICVDCNDCTVPKKSGELHKDCKNTMYVLATYASEGESVFMLFVVDVRGKLLHKAELTCLPQRNVSVRIKGKILCTRNEVVIFDIDRHQVYLCTRRGELEKPLDIARQKRSLILSTATISDENEIVVLESPNKIHFYSISNERFLDDQGFEACNEVKTMAFNHVSNEVNILCKDGRNSREYHLMCYAKRAGELQQDMKLQEDRYDFWANASLISHPSGPVVLLDNNRLLNLQ